MVRPDPVRGHRRPPVGAAVDAAVFEDEPHHEARHRAALSLGSRLHAPVEHSSPCRMARLPEGSQDGSRMLDCLFLEDAESGYVLSATFMQRGK